MKHNLKPIKKKLIQELFETKLKNMPSKDTFNLYVENPFCINHCKYCTYEHCYTNIGNELYNYYYFNYLPELIKSFESTLKLRTADSIYFGGGTASLMTPKIMELIFNQFPNFPKIKNKVFESHPSTLNQKKLDLLVKNNFSYISFGIQSMKPEVLKSQNRIIFNTEKVRNQIAFLQDNGVRVNCDLLAFIPTGTVNDIKLLAEDLVECTEKLKPDWITIYPLYQCFESICTFQNNTFHFKKPEWKEAAYKKLFALRKALLHFTEQSNGYHLLNYRPKEILQDEEILKHPYMNFFVGKISRDDFCQARTYSSGGFSENPPHQNVIPFGVLPGTKVYGYLGHDFEYYLKNEDWVPKYYQHIRQ